MKTRLNLFLTVLVILVITSVAGFSQENKVDLKSPEVQKQVFEQILNDQQLMMNFVEQMKANDNAMKMMMGNIMMCCDTDASICKNMSAIMAEHDKLLEQLGQVLEKKEDSKYSVQKRPRHQHK